MDANNHIGRPILIVEDSKAQQTVLAALVENFGFTPHVVSSAGEALEAVRVMLFAAIMMDIRMPDMDGFECSRLIRQMERGNRRVPIIAVSAADRDKIFDAKCKAAGIDECVSKPFEAEQHRRTLLRCTYSPAYPNLRLLPKANTKRTGT